MPIDFDALLATDDALLDARWAERAAWVEAQFQREPTIEAILFLMGIQARGHGYEPKLAKQRKQDLIMEGSFCAFATLGLYKQVGMDPKGFWIWERTQPLPDMDVESQEKLLKIAILRYFDELEAAPVEPPVGE